MNRKFFKILIVTINIFVTVAFSIIGSRVSFRIGMQKQLKNTADKKILEFDIGLKDQISLSTQMAKSPLIISYMKDTSDAYLKKLAFDEVSAYQSSFLSDLTFMIAEDDLKYYSNNELIYILDKKDPSSSWYMNTMKISKAYDFNANYDKGLGKTFMWVNAVVNDGSKNIGLIGTGIPVSDFVNSMYESITDNINLFLYNYNGEITGSKNIEYIENKTRITALLPVMNEHDIYPSSTDYIYFSDFWNEYCIASIPTIGWYAVLWYPFNLKAFFINVIPPMVVLLFAFIIEFLILTIRHVIGPLSQLKDAIEGIASGNADLTRRINVGNRADISMLKKLSNGFNKFMEKLHVIISAIKDSKEELTKSGTDLKVYTNDAKNSINCIMTDIESLQAQITNQSGDVATTSSAVNEVSANIESLDRMIGEQSKSVSQASAAIEQMIGNIASVNSSVEKLSNAYKILEENTIKGVGIQEDVNNRIQKIQADSEMLQEANLVISSIADQTNLLAMNAAIEAAHAGEAGKGFSVVADEIRKLSETSAEQSHTIGEQLQIILDSISGMVTASEDSKNAFYSVSDNIKSTNTLVQQIATAMAEQEEGSRQINDALSIVNDSTSEVRASSAEMTAGNKATLDGIRNLQEATYTMKQKMQDMANTAKLVGNVGVFLEKLSSAVENSIENIGEKIDQFKV